MQSGLRVNQRIVIPTWELEFSTSRSSGPGGQHANKTSSRVTLRWHLERSSVLTTAQKDRVRRRHGHRIDTNGYVLIHVETERSQLRNKEEAKSRLVALLLDGLQIEKGRRNTRPTKASKKRRLDNKRQRSDQKKLRRKPVQGD